MTTSMELTRPSALGATITGPFAQGHMFNQDLMHGYTLRERGLCRSLDGLYGVRHVLGGKHPETLDQLHQLAHTKLSRGHLSEAEKLFSQAWEGRKETLGADHPMTLKSLRELALVKRRCGWTDASQELLHSSSCHGLTTRHPTTSRAHAASMRTLGSSLKAVGRLSSLEQTLCSSMAAGQSQSVGSITYKPVNKYVTPCTKRTHGEGSLDKKNDAAHAKGRRLDEDVAEVLLREFALILFRKYGCCEKAFHTFDLNGNGTLSSSEFVHYASTIYEGDCVALFKALDVDRLGDVSVKEFEKLGKLYKLEKAGMKQHREAD